MYKFSVSGAIQFLLNGTLFVSLSQNFHLHLVVFDNEILSWIRLFLD